MLNPHKNQERNGILGYRQITIKLNREHNLKVNHKRIYRLMRILNLKSVCRRKRKSYIQSTPEITAENILNNELVFKTFDMARKEYPNGPPFHSDRGFQYKSKSFQKKLVDARMIQSMSRVSRCIISKNLVHTMNWKLQSLNA